MAPCPLFRHCSVSDTDRSAVIPSRGIQGYIVLTFLRCSETYQRPQAGSDTYRSQTFASAPSYSCIGSDTSQHRCQGALSAGRKGPAAQRPLLTDFRVVRLVGGYSDDSCVFSCRGPAGDAPIFENRGDLFSLTGVRGR